jgi:hypothetical protein
LFHTAHTGIEEQIQFFLPGSILISNNSPQADTLCLTRSADAHTLSLTRSEKILKYLSAQPAVSSMIPFKLACVQIETRGYTMGDVYALCLHPDALNLLARYLHIEQGDFTLPQKRGVMVSDRLIERLFQTFNLRYKVGDLLTLSHTPVASAFFSRCTVPLSAVYTLTQSKNEFDFISNLIILDYTSFDIITNLPLGMINLDPAQKKLKLDNTEKIFNGPEPLFTRVELRPNRHSMSSLFSLLGDPGLKYASLPAETSAWQGIVLTVRESVAQNSGMFRRKLTRFFDTQHIPALAEDWPADNIPVLRRFASKHTIFIIMLIFSGLAAVAISTVISRPTKKQLHYISETGAAGSNRRLVLLFARQAVLRGMLYGLLGIITAGSLFLCFLHRPVSGLENSWICTLCESVRLNPAFHIPGLVYALIFLFVYSISSWMYAFFYTKKTVLFFRNKL